MQFATLFVVVFAAFSMSTVYGFITQGYQCNCPSPSVIYKPVYVNCPTNPGGNPTQPKNCFYRPCNSTDTAAACGFQNGMCKLYRCQNDLYNEGCRDNTNIDNVNLKYCSGLVLGGPSGTCSSL